MAVFTQPEAGLQVSAVHRFPSLQLIVVFTQPVCGSQESFVHLL
jgi:hypothetical protein